MAHKVDWKDAPEPHDFPAAAEYLSLLADPDRVDVLVDRLRSAPPSTARPRTSCAPRS